MYCKNCGSSMDPNAVVCVRCGVARGTGYAYCYNCGRPMVMGAVVCTNCGAAAAPAVSAGSKSKLTAGLLGIFLGALGIHNFYLGFTGKAPAQLLMSVLSCGMLAAVSGIWGLVEGIMLLCGQMNVDAQGNLLRD